MTGKQKALRPHPTSRMERQALTAWRGSASQGICSGVNNRARCSPAASLDSRISRILVHLQRGDEGFLRNLDAAELAHLLLAFLLLVEKLALAADVAAPTHVLQNPERSSQTSEAWAPNRLQ